MKKSIALVSIVIVASLGSLSFVLSSSGIAGYTGSPGEQNCSSCHSGGTSAAAGTTITSVPSFTANEFEPGTTYAITVQLAAAGFNRYGFGCEILNASNANAGTMQNAGSGVQFLFSGQRRNAVQTTPKAGTGGTTFSFDWVAPLVGDTATIYVAGNAVNNNNSSSEDFVIPPIKRQLKARQQPVDTTITSIKENRMKDLSNLTLYPNPAANVSTISYVLSSNQQVSIQLLDLKGKVIKTFVDEKQLSGAHQIFLDLQDVAQGLYFVKTSLANQKVSQKLITIQ